MTPRLSWSPDINHDQEQITHLRDVARRLDLNRTAAESVGQRMTLLTRTEWSNAWQESIVAVARQVLTTLKACDDACADVIQRAGLSVDRSTAVAEKLLQFAMLLLDVHGVDLRFAFTPTIKTIRAATQQAISLLHDYQSLEESLSQSYAAQSIRRIEVDKLKNDWVAASAKFWLFGALAKKKVAKRLRETVGATNIPDVEADMPRLEALKALVEKIDALDPDLRQLPGWAALDTDVARMSSTLKLADGLRSSLARLAGPPDQFVRLMREAQQLIVDGNELLVADGPIAESVRRLAHSYKALCETTGKFGQAAGGPIDLGQQVSELLINAQAIVDSKKILNAWCGWQRVRQEAVGCGLQSLVEAVEQSVLPDGSVADAFEVAYARWFAAKAIDSETLLRNFVPAEHQSDIQTYTNAVDGLAELTSAYIRTKLSGAIPDKNAVTQRSGFGTLKHELQKSRRYKPVRQLAQEMGEAFTSLAPCMLMSPLSIAQYLPADHQLFDLVIFDEASQIAPWDAVGSIARGKQIVVAGDPNQMPHTSFFNRVASSGEDDTDEDLESILEECIGAGVPQHSLTWHYRSRHESLITFSNYRYYKGSLVTFPAADTRPSAVTWRKVDGVYSRGKTRHNQVEAKAIVDEVVQRLTSPEFIASKQSIGIITLNADQQQLVADLLDRARRQHPSIEPFFKGELAEPVVVKNLETMQGDERDLIILGIGFGPTEPGANIMSMNFGPLNRGGGWRRLNVAVTRARREMLIFTSFDPSMIDLNRTSAEAVRDLRNFIDFADRGPKAIASAVRGSQGSYDSPFEQYVADGLRAKGWETRPQIGVSRFRIDLGVVHPDRPGDYLVGVECDGATYHSAATARDRDKVRSEILRGLDWRLVRVWSTEWWVDREGALERLHQSVSTILEESRVAFATLERAKAEAAVAAAQVTAAEGAAIAEIDTIELSDEEGDVFVAQAASVKVDNFEPSAFPLVADGPTHEMGVSLQSAYRKADLSGLESSLRPELFQDAAYDATLETLIQRILEQEAPILDKLLVDRVARAHGFKRSGRRINERVLDLTERRHHLSHDPELDHADFVWLNADDRECWNSYRVPTSDDDIRHIEEIAMEELAVAAREILGDDISVGVARKFHVRRLSNEARSRIVAATDKNIRAVPND